MPDPLAVPIVNSSFSFIPVPDELADLVEVAAGMHLVRVDEGAVDALEPPCWYKCQVGIALDVLA
jgi:hypothetical protein